MGTWESTEVKKPDLETLKDSHTFNTLKKKKRFLECRFSVCVYSYVRTCAPLALELSRGFYLCVKHVSIVVWCQVNLRIPPPKIWALQMSSKTHNGYFLDDFKD